MMLESTSFQSKEVMGAQNSVFLFCACNHDTARQNAIGHRAANHRKGGFRQARRKEHTSHSQGVFLHVAVCVAVCAQGEREA